MRTVGIDLSSQPKKTAMCEIEWSEESAHVLSLQVGVTDAKILDLATEVRNEEGAVGIDAPFGWPKTFIDFINHDPATGPRTVPADPRELYYRLTDLRVIAAVKLFPLAVAADKIAHPALRCAVILDKLGVVDRSGVNGVFEVYPAAALKAWGLPHNGLKPGGAAPALAKANLEKVFDQVRASCPRLNFSPEAKQLCAANDDAFDALIAALVTRAAALGRTIRPDTPEEIDRARTEGWIAIPTGEGKLDGLFKL